jgi:acetyl esterase/lipase
MASEKGIVFAHRPEMDLHLDIYRPEGEANGCAIVFVHGGGWRRGTREMMRPAARAMAEHGFVGLPMQYRVSDQAPWPAHIHDVKAAIRWTRAHADDLGVDPDRIVLWGSSAGAHLALLAAGTPGLDAFEGPADEGAGEESTAVAAVVAVHAPTSFSVGERQYGATPAAALMGAAATEEAARTAGPLSYASAEFPPTLLLHGTEDRVVHHSASLQMFDALRAVHAPVDMHLFHGCAHGFAAMPSMRAAVVAEAATFLDRTLIDPGRYAREAEEWVRLATAITAAPAAPTLIGGHQ